MYSHFQLRETYFCNQPLSYCHHEEKSRPTCRLYSPS